MTNSRSRSAGRHIAAALLAATALVFAASPAQAQVPGLDFYVGGAIGTGDVAISDADKAVGQFKEDHTAFKFFTGVRAASFGAELEYFNFGETSGSFGVDPDVDGKLTGIGGYGLLYLPLPLPVVDVYAKAGLARLNRRIRDLSTGDFSTKDTDFAYGAGVQVKVGSLGIRGEYQRFNTPGKDPTLLSLGVTLSFL